MSTRFLFIYDTTKLMETSDARSASIYNTTFLHIFYSSTPSENSWKNPIGYYPIDISMKIKNSIYFDIFHSKKKYFAFFIAKLYNSFIFFLYKTYILQIMNYNAVTAKYWLTHFNLQVFINLIVFIAARVFSWTQQYDRKKSEWFFLNSIVRRIIYSLSFLHK